MELLRPPLTRVNGGLKAFTRLLLRLQAQARCGGRGAWRLDPSRRRAPAEEEVDQSDECG